MSKIFFPVLFLLFACNEKKLSAAEESFLLQLQDECGCEASLMHDRTAIGNNAGNGVFHIDLINSTVYYCNMDPVELERIANNVARRFAVIMEHKGNYSNIQVEFSQMKKDEVNCSRKFMVRRP
ncbi:hypothetical protein [Chitinophaga niabensis]|uniref:Lipoprotein n=1 Tax=Chitinophaga niabensis TaxID=536979 RepID=A0A1N6K9H2_9BACT|nr:hypothetical protein [Chitinophaga niabensis]SIO53202.1 hypothetical protein SAMN04488055_5370 [Chitinophaga niabensis]